MGRLVNALRYIYFRIALRIYGRNIYYHMDNDYVDYMIDALEY